MNFQIVMLGAAALLIASAIRRVGVIRKNIWAGRGARSARGWHEAVALLVLLAVGLFSGCAMKGELRRCYGLALPFVKIGFCDRLRAKDVAALCPAPEEK